MTPTDTKSILEKLGPSLEAIADPNVRLIITQIIEAQRQEIALLKQKIEELEEKLKTNSKNSSKPPSSDGFKKEEPKKKKKKGKNKRKQGGQPGHRGVSQDYLPLESVDKIEKISPPKECPCGALVIPTSDYKRHQVHDLPLIKPFVTEWQLYMGTCCGCGKKHMAELPPGVPRGFLGLRPLAMIGTLTGDYRMSKRNVTFLLEDFFGLRVSLGTVSNAEKIVSKALELPVQEAKDFIPQQDVVHGDETSHAECGQKMWTWAFIAARVAAFVIRPSRGSQVAKDFLGETFQGILNTDRWSAYTWLAAIFRQICWAHLLRDFRKISERRGLSKRLGKDLLELTHEMFSHWNKVRDGTLSRMQFQELMKPIRIHVEDLLTQGTQCKHNKTKGMCKQILKLKQALWTFVDKEGVEPTNNLAEQTLRRIVIWRKTSFGTQSSRGTLYLERIMTVVATCKLQKRNVLDFVTQAIQAHFSNTELPSLLPSYPKPISLPLAA
ncbi:MAG TPA: IS66 family transposase [Holosporales bacterium]|nr:IS66 family transposase [Holosporales bacterium]HCC23998.1 IS66 family transposase [Holosporales bacterium]HCE95610.1 IS66 family transposase [Holosporales bacterium]